MSTIELMLRDNLRLDYLNHWFWSEFDCTTSKKLRPECTTFSDWEKGIGFWWALGDPVKILEYIVVGYVPSFSSHPPQMFCYHNENFKDEKTQHEDEDLINLLNKDVEEGKMIKCPKQCLEIVMPSFKQVGLDKTRRIWDARPLNLFIPRYKKRLPSLQDIMWCINVNDVVLTVDLKGAYSQIRLHPSVYKFFGVIAGNKTFAYTTLPFGLRSEVFVFSTFMDVIKRYLNMFVKIHIYIDDALMHR